MDHARARTIVGIAVMGAALTVAALPASAAVADAPVLSSSAVGAVGATGAAKAGPIAGYDFAAKVTQGSTTFKVPDVTGCTADLAGIGLGLGVEDVPGTPTTLGSVFVACVSGAPYFQLDATANGVRGTGDGSDVAAGDSITVSYKVTGSNLTVTVKDSTSGGTVTSTGPAPHDSHLTFGSFPLYAAGEGPLPVPNFGKASFAKSKVNIKAPKTGTKINGAHIAEGKYAAGAFTLTYSKKI